MSEQMIDAFTLRHLDEWIDCAVYYDEQDDFRAWAIAQITDDITLVDLSWPLMYRAWMNRDIVSVTRIKF